MTEYELEELNAELRYDAVDDLSTRLLTEMSEIIFQEGGDGYAFTRWLCGKEVPSVMMDALLEAMPNNYGTGE